MQYEITNTARGVSLSPDDLDLIGSDLGRRLDPLLESFPQDAAYLRVLINDEAGRPFVEVTLRLSLHGDLILAHEVGPAFRPAFEQALGELRRQVLAYKDRHGRDRSRKQRQAATS